MSDRMHDVDWALDRVGDARVAGFGVVSLKTAELLAAEVERLRAERDRCWLTHGQAIEPTAQLRDRFFGLLRERVREPADRVELANRLVDAVIAANPGTTATHQGEKMDQKLTGRRRAELELELAQLQRELDRLDRLDALPDEDPFRVGDVMRWVVTDPLNHVYAIRRAGGWSFTGHTEQRAMGLGWRSLLQHLRDTGVDPDTVEVASSTWTPLAGAIANRL